MYTGPQPMKVARMNETGVDGRRKLLENLKPGTNYVVEIQAQTRKGWGIRLLRTEKTVAWAGTTGHFQLYWGWGEWYPC